MENQIFAIKNTFYESLVIRENELWMSVNKVKSLEKFEAAAAKTGMMKSVVAIPFSSVTEISYNEASESTKIKYVDEKGKAKKTKLGFGDSDLSNQFGEYLGEKLNLNKTAAQESQTKPLLINGLFLLAAIGITIFLATADSSDLEVSGRRRAKGALLKMIVESIGQTGVFIVGGLISAYLAHQLYQRFQNPSSDIVYS